MDEPIDRRGLNIDVLVGRKPLEGHLCVDNPDHLALLVRIEVGIVGLAGLWVSAHTG